MDGVQTNVFFAQRCNFPEIFSSAVWTAIWPAALEIYMVYAFLIQKVHEEGRKEERTPRKCKNGWRIKASDTAVTLHALQLFSTVWATSENRGSYPLLAGVIVYHPSRKQSNCLHGKVIVVKHLMYLLLSLKSI